LTAQVSFVKDASGKITGAKILQAGQTTEASKID
jgi:hypothetical protein